MCHPVDDEPLLIRHRHVSISMEEQHELLKEQLMIAQTIKNPGMYTIWLPMGVYCVCAFHIATRHSKEKNLRREINQLRRQMKQQSKKQIDEGTNVVLLVPFYLSYSGVQPSQITKEPSWLTRQRRTSKSCSSRELASHCFTSPHSC